MAQKLKKIAGVLDRKSVYYLSMAAVFIIEFLCLGEKGYVLREDSPAYLTFTGRVGIMPLYPLFLYVNRRLLGEGIYLYAVFVEQTALAGISIFALTEFMRRRFRLSYIASYPVYLFAMFMPFTVNYPESISNHDILTEGLAFPLFYFYMICFLKSIFDKKYKDIALLILVSIPLALTRTQLQLMAVLNAAAFFYVAWMKGRSLRWARQIGRGILYVFAAAMIVVVSEGMVLGGNSVGQRVIAAISRSEAQAEEAAVEEEAEKAVREVSGESMSGESVSQDKESTQTTAETVSNVTSQYGHLLIDKAVYEIDEDDYLLFEDEEMQKLCRAIFEAADSRGSRYVYARNDLWMWQDIMNGIGSGVDVVNAGWAAYLDENSDTDLSYSAVNQIAATLALEHLGRIIYHTLCMMPQGFICTVFFQKSSIYLLCHILTLLIYLSAFVLVIWGYRNQKIPRQYPEALLGCIVINVLFVVIVSVMFFAMQRYLVYCFGIFYAAYYASIAKFFQYYFEQRKNQKKLD